MRRLIANLLSKEALSGVNAGLATWVSPIFLPFDLGEAQF